MNKPRHHHFVPRFYLEGFCAEDAQGLAVYDRVRNAYRTQRPAEVAHRRDYYAYEDEQGNRFFDIEVALSEVETAASRSIQRVDNGGDLSDEDRMVLATYVAFQHTRTPAYAAWLEAFRAHGAGREEVEALPEPPDAAVGRVEAIDVMLRHAPRFAHVFLQLNWTIWRRESERISFVTSDSPVCRVWRDQPEEDVYAGAGFLSPEVITILPLSQASALAMSGIGDQMAQRPLTRDQVRRVNLAVVNQAQHYVFGRDSMLVENLVRRTGINRRQWQPPLRVG
ncbi:DUF4238 domain-containing protein [Burkholderia contaminans]|uniref:DUF4238 domain-containing protein n=1 Tax=Burkholderia TaxID=32008 RepID=UPI001C686E06|nr:MULTISPECIES: DUF4238 domain-containing protein [Burkholderia]MBW5805075.1 DUF4238 domain-containing protein [Burkholderia sp. COPS]MCA7916337.1 DUF4238 domain-containing protein [Burkholderia contaminans]MCA8095653.1 DUF4238 domain-containing protein [Burkholderia contaminans]UUX40285.1 DUF4238 domain-containing protein [Burkholderia contaminans]